ncbi:MAG: hypothetical protein CME32_12540 [Gimesia sp.]|nr:hypothetical protein [Gimesia sp.]
MARFGCSKSLTDLHTDSSESESDNRLFLKPRNRSFANHLIRTLLIFPEITLQIIPFSEIDFRLVSANDESFSSGEITHKQNGILNRSWTTHI